MSHHPPEDRTLDAESAHDAATLSGSRSAKIQAELGPDWNAPAYPDAKTESTTEPLQVEVIGGEMLNKPPK